jgi:hypothetical protein
MAHKIKNAKKIQSKSRTHKITDVGGGFRVESGASGKSYFVRMMGHGAICSCNWAKYRPAMDKRSGCSHVVSVYNHIQESQGRRASAWVSEGDAKRQHRPLREIGDGVWLTSRKVAQTNDDLFG